MLGLLFGANALGVTRHVPTCVLVALPDEESRPACRRIAPALRSRGIATEVAPEPAKFGKQIRYADRRGIPFVWFPGVDGMSDQVKDIRSGDQVQASAPTGIRRRGSGAADLRDLTVGVGPPQVRRSPAGSATDVAGRRAGRVRADAAERMRRTVVPDGPRPRGALT